jgi:hypothetical protein
VEYPGLAAAVAERVAAVLPEGMTAGEEGGSLRLAAAGERWEAFPLDRPEVEEEIDPESYDPPFPAFAVLEALDFVQEFVRYEAGEELPEPWAELGDGEIRLGFGDTALEPIPVP